jgi:hypothetical protein
MLHMKQRFLQVGVIILAASMLGGYVVHSQKSQSSGQPMPGSKTKQLPAGVGHGAQSDVTPASGVLSTNSPHLMMSSSKGGVFVTSSQQAQVFGAASQPAPGPVWVLPATNHSAVFMSSSKFATVVRPEALQAMQTSAPASKPPSRMIMPGSKSFIMPAPAGSGAIPAVATNIPPATR